LNTKAKYSLLEAKPKLESYCAYQERCAQDINKKLTEWLIFGEDRDILIADLITNNFLNEERFATAYASGKLRIKHWGKNKIIAHLKAKRISAYSINKAIKSIDVDDYENIIFVVAKKKWADIKGKDKWDKLAKLNRFLYGRGFESDLIKKTIQSITKTNA